ncbi:MAG: glycosyltransferase family 4 protein [Candidatus Krumholzibacteriota bacterium]|nr:glycosyltransferase family 4 protein [Candidatus Krumholzibacteriota bacterium]
MRHKLKNILVLSIWEDLWSLGEGSGVPDELHFIEQFTAKNVEIHYLIPEPPGNTPPLSAPGLTFHTYPNIFRRYARYPSFLKRFLIPALFPSAVGGRLKELIESVRPDVVLGYTYYSFYPLSKLGGKFDLPTAVKLFGVMYLDFIDLPRFRYWWYNYEQILALRFPVDRYIVLNDGTRGRRALERAGIPSPKISLLPNGMNKEWADISVDREKAREEFSLPPDKVLLVTFSRLSRSKRIGLFLETAAALDPALLREAAVVIGGDGPDREKLEKMVEPLGLRGKVHFTGAIPHQEIPRFLKACDVFVGTNELTNMSMPPCEAMLCGLPVVAFDTCGTAAVVREGETGLLAPDGDTRRLAGRIEELLRDPELIKRLGRQAGRFARERFMSWEERISREFEILENLIS